MGTWEARTVGGSTLGLFHYDETAIPRVGEAITVRNLNADLSGQFEVVRVEHWPADRAVVVTCSRRPPSTAGYGGHPREPKPTDFGTEAETYLREEPARWTEGEPS